MELRQRKKNRLQGYDYGRPGYYFVTVCIEKRAAMLGKAVRACRGAQCAPAHVVLSDAGQNVEHAILQIPKHHPNVSVDKFVVMPNHVHMIISVDENDGRAMRAPTYRSSIPQIVRGMKEAVTKALGYNMWQKSYHDHIIRNDADYRRIWEYIDTNPAKWREDCYYEERE